MARQTYVDVLECDGCGAVGAAIRLPSKLQVFACVKANRCIFDPEFFAGAGSRPVWRKWSNRAEKGDNVRPSATGTPASVRQDDGYILEDPILMSLNCWQVFSYRSYPRIIVEAVLWMVCSAVLRNSLVSALFSLNCRFKFWIRIKRLRFDT